MFSCNAPVPGRVSRLADRMHPDLVGFDSLRDHHALTIKRLGEPGPGGVDRLAARMRRALSGLPPVEARIDGLGLFENPPLGPGPVVYLSVESPGIREAHERLIEEFDAVEGLEGDGYVLHVTLARGGDLETARRLCEREIEPVSWTLEELHLYDAADGKSVRQISLPARA